MAKNCELFIAPAFDAYIGVPIRILPYCLVWKN